MQAIGPNKLSPRSLTWGLSNRQNPHIRVDLWTIGTEESSPIPWGETHLLTRTGRGPATWPDQAAEYRQSLAQIVVFVLAIRMQGIVWIKE